MLVEESIPNEQLRHARFLRGWTQSQLAEAVGTDNETVSRWERGITLPSFYYRAKLCDVLGKTAEELGFLAERSELRSASRCVLLACAYTDAEHKIVTQFKADLQDHGIVLLSSRAVRRKGEDNPRKALKEAIHAAQMVLVIASPKARSSRHVLEALQLAKIYRRPICTIWIEGASVQDCLPAEAGDLFTIIDARQEYDLSLQQQVVDALERVQQASSPSSPEAALLVATPVEQPQAITEPYNPRNPYKGLHAFQQEDACDFFGRERLIDELLAALAAGQQNEHEARLLAIIGPSGSGKSSVVMAGLLPRLRAGALPGSEEWLYLDPIIPGAHPLESLALAFAKYFPEKSLKTFCDDLEDDSVRSLHLLASTLTRREGKRVLLYVDQFEELFTQTLVEEERQHFIDLLIQAITEPGGPLLVLLTLRADFYDRPARYPALFRLIEQHQHFVLPMDIKDLRAVIERPAALPDVRLTFEGDLVGDLLFEMQGQVGILPLLQFTLDQLFEQRQGNQLTLQAYHEMGGIKGALSRHAECTYAQLLSEEHRRLAHTLFLRLIDPGVTEKDSTRRRAPFTEFTLDDSSKSRLLRETIDAFIDARLLTTNTLAGIPTVEVSHEALIREWGRLADWLHEAREDIRLQQAISKDVATWEQSNQRRDWLYRGSQLREAQAWARRNLPSGKETAFLRASFGYSLWLLARMVVIVILLASTTGVALWSIMLLLSNSTTVTTLGDGGSGSLRQILTTAKVGSTITFDPALVAGTISLTSDLNITQSVIIRGPGAGKLFISSENDNDVIQVLRDVTVTISGLTFANSRLRGLFSFINNEGTLTISHSTVSGNSTYGSGGGISNQGDLTISESTIAGNSSWNAVGSGGGGIFNQNQGFLKITDSIVSNNRADASGGGIENQGTLIIEHSTIAGNSSLNSGGGIRSTGPLTILNSMIAGNSSLDSGGGIDNQDQLTITGSTISENTTSNLGGGINNDEVLKISNSLILSNRASDSGGGIANKGKLTISNSKIAHNMANGSGGGIDYQENSLDQKSPSTLTDCTISSNTAYSGGGIFKKGLNVSQHLKINNCIVAGNSAFSGPDVAGT